MWLTRRGGLEVAPELGMADSGGSEVLERRRAVRVPVMDRERTRDTGQGQDQGEARFPNRESPVRGAMWSAGAHVGGCHGLVATL